MIAFSKKSLVLYLVVILGTVSCQTLFHDEPVLALLADNNDDDQAQIRSVLEKALNEETVLLSDNLFVTKSFLVIEKKFRRSLEGNLAGGSILISPDRFVLLKDSKGCLIRHVNTERTWRLKNTSCIRGTIKASAQGI